VSQYILQSLYYNLVDMNKLTPNIQEVMVFLNWLSVKQKSVETGLEIVLYSPIWTLEINTFIAPNFIYICTLIEHATRNNFSFGSVA
jgi:hypothetical protein